MFIGKMMAPTSIKESKEYFIFETLANQPDIRSAFTAFSEYDATHPKDKILPSEREKIAVKQVYDAFKKAEKSLTKNNAKPNYSDAETMRKMFEAVKKNIYQKCSCPQVGPTGGGNGVCVNKFNIGRILLQFIHNIAYERGVVTPKITRHKPLAETNRHGNVAFGYLNDKANSTYKTNAQIIRERMAKEK